MNWSICEAKIKRIVLEALEFHDYSEDTEELLASIIADKVAFFIDTELVALQPDPTVRSENG